MLFFSPWSTKVLNHLSPLGSGHSTVSVFPTLLFALLLKFKSASSPLENREKGQQVKRGEVEVTENSRKDREACQELGV